MSAQTHYGRRAFFGAPGGLLDVTPMAVDSFANGEELNVMKYGVAVVNAKDEETEDTLTETVVLPTSASTVKDVLGITCTDRTSEHGLEGELYVRSRVAINVLAWGRIWARVPEGITTQLNDDVYVITQEGETQGFLTNEETNLKLNARFITPVDKAMNTAAEVYVAGVELYRQG
ncbi:MAG: hypothetical protein LUD47_07625 [Clostridia bacterium]|nr:hypothetical protein [Clostridia bacterium]